MQQSIPFPALPPLSSVTGKPFVSGSNLLQELLVMQKEQVKDKISPGLRLSLAC